MDETLSTIFAVLVIIGGGILIYVFGVKSFESLVHGADAVTIFKNFLLTFIGCVAVGLGIKAFTK